MDQYIEHVFHDRMLKVSLNGNEVSLGLRASRLYYASAELSVRG